MLLIGSINIIMNSDLGEIILVEIGWKDSRETPTHVDESCYWYP